MFDRKTKLVSMREMLRRYHNTFIEKLLGNILDLKRHIDIVEQDPTFTRPNKMGQPVPVQGLIAENKNNINNVQEYLYNIKELLSLSDSGLLARADELKAFDIPPIPEPPIPEPKEKYEVIKGLEYPRRVAHKVGVILELTKKEAAGFKKGLIKKSEKK